MGPHHTPWGKVCLELELKSGYLLSHPKLTFWGLAVASWALSLPTAWLDPLLSHSSPGPSGPFLKVQDIVCPCSSLQESLGDPAGVTASMTLRAPAG